LSWIAAWLQVAVGVAEDQRDCGEEEKRHGGAS
jgi:hypothetical protein